MFENLQTFNGNYVKTYVLCQDGVWILIGYYLLSDVYYIVLHMNPQLRYLIID